MFGNVLVPLNPEIESFAAPTGVGEQQLYVFRSELLSIIKDKVALQLADDATLVGTSTSGRPAALRVAQGQEGRLPYLDSSGDC